MTPRASEPPRSGNEQERSPGKLGKGTATKGRLSHAPPEPEGRGVGRPQPPYEVVGVDALSPLLEHVEFPATKEDVNERIGHLFIPVTIRDVMTVRQILDDTAPTRFQSSAELEDAVERVWDRIVRGGVRGGQPKQGGGEYLSERPRRE